MNNVMREEYRPLTNDESLAVLEIKAKGRQFWELLDAFAHQSRELSLAKTKIEEAVMWATKHITR